MEKTFPSAYNVHCESLDSTVLKWAWKQGLFESVAELERTRLQQVNKFPGFIFPELPKDKLEPIMKLLLGLFLLDDFLDIQPSYEKVSYLELLVNPSFSNFSQESRIERLAFQIADLQKTIGNSHFEFKDSPAWNEVWETYIQGLLWEQKNKIEKRVPPLDEYQLRRPHSSGVFLAIQLLRPKGFNESCDSLQLEKEIARFICLSNDLDSLVKESVLEDFHNEVVLLQLSTDSDPTLWVLNDLKRLQKRIFRRADLLSKVSPTCSNWVNSLLHLVGGCIAWSSSTLRYKTSVNGKSRLIQ